MFSTEKKEISHLPEEYFVKNLLPLKDKFNNYQLAITGPISVGKSTMLEYLYNLFTKYDFILPVLYSVISRNLRFSRKCGLIPRYIAGINSFPELFGVIYVFPG